MKKYIEIEVIGNSIDIKRKDNSYFGLGHPDDYNIIEMDNDKINKDRVKQSIKLKEAGFTIDEIIEIIGELKDSK